MQGCGTTLQNHEQEKIEKQELSSGSINFTGVVTKLSRLSMDSNSLTL